MDRYFHKKSEDIMYLEERLHETYIYDCFRSLPVGRKS